MRRFTYSLFLGLLFSSLAMAQFAPSFDEAKLESVEKSKILTIVFSGSDWCKSCIKLNKEILETPQFSAYANNVLAVYNADFPYKKKQDAALKKVNESLADKYNPDGIFPLVVFIKNDKVVYKLGYKSISPEEYVGLLKQNL